MIFVRAYKYLKYILLSKHRKGHGIHSPFIYDLITRVFRNKIDSSIVFRIEKSRKMFFSDRRFVEMVDFGSGSEKSRLKTKSVSAIIRKSSVPSKYGVLLSRMAAEFGRNHIIELGTSLGISAMYLAEGCPGAIVSTIEGSPEIAAIARGNLKEAGLKNVNVYTGTFDDLLPYLLNNGTEPGLVFIDGNHRREPLMKYFKMLTDAPDRNIVLMIDDINYSWEMTRAWNEIKQSGNVSATIDLNRIGIVFFRKGITNKNYWIRY